MRDWKDAEFDQLALCLKLDYKATSLFYMSGKKTCSYHLPLSDFLMSDPRLFVLTENLLNKMSTR